MILNCKPVKKTEFYEKLKEIQIEYFKSGERVYNITLEQLQTIANKFNWICEYDELEIKGETNIQEVGDKMNDQSMNLL